MNKLYINGIDFTEDVIEGLDDLTIEAGLNSSTKTVGKILSNDITVTGDAYYYLKNHYFSNCNSWQNSDKALFQTDLCGGMTIDCEITSEGMEWNPKDEEMSFNLKSTDQVSRAYARLESEYVTENGFIENIEIPIMYYCDQPNWMQWVILFLTVQIRLVFNIIDTAINTICKVLSFGAGDCDVNISGAIFSAMDTWITGTGRWAPAPLVREMLDYQCQAVGLKFQSSILNDQASSRYNLSMVCLTGGVHGDYKDISKVERVRVFKDNSPLYTTIGLLDSLTDVFNAEYRIIGDTLYFERVDFFFDICNQKLFNTADHCLSEPLKISYNTRNAVAYGEYSYSQDAYDMEGNKTLKSYYQEKVEFNDPYNPAQKGKKSRQIRFSPARFMFDTWLFNSSGFFNFAIFIDEFRDGPENWLDENFLALDGLRRKYDLIISGGTLAYEKLIVLEPNFNRSDAMAYRVKHGVKGNKTYWNYNTPMHLAEEEPYAELVKDFLYLDNPRVREDLYEISDFSIECDCDVINATLNNFQRLYIEDKNVKIIPGKISMTFADGKVKIELSEMIGLCN